MVAEFFYHCTNRTENFGLMAYLKMKLCFFKVGKSDACIRQIRSHIFCYINLFGIQKHHQTARRLPVVRQLAIPLHLYDNHILVTTYLCPQLHLRLHETWVITTCTTAIGSGAAGVARASPLFMQ